MNTNFAHAALTVKNTDRCLEFYCGLLGMKLDIDFGMQPADIKTNVEGSQMRVTLIADANGNQVLETFEFIDAEQRRFEDKCRHTDYWCPHIALTVDNLKEVYDKLVDAGIEVSIPFTDVAGYKFAYVYDYDGFLVELIDASTY
ncbi:VOC family protein [Adlercreutzia sp. ZJ242]|uniref:VOC family protein n=1 Tax=Adlercreutzia sp. ZJ242 TaxID=2709409 RepID=UPI0013ED90A6|nr:VOC family protein [Adlercreutzia sp. ZJ242]